MIQVTILQGNKKDIIRAPEGTRLLDVLRDNGYQLAFPCGGNGICGKCSVELIGEGTVTSCFYHIHKNMEVLLPDERKQGIIASQHKNCVTMPLNTGNFDELSTFPHGVAIDIGTTSLVFYLVNLITGTLTETRAVLNPQAKYGADVITRINYCAVERNGLQRLNAELIESINQELEHFVSVTGLTNDDLVSITIAGNPTMLHLLMGVNPLPIALAPFKPAFIEEQRVPGYSLNLICNRMAEVKILPSVSAYVGADIVSGIAALDFPEDKNHLFVDIGTNGEMALITPGRIFCCATAAGPAFEGANISCGMGAVEGAISEFSHGKIHVIGNVMPKGICGSALIDVVAYLLEKKILGSDGFMNESYEIVANIKISPEDIREVQLAKSAIITGIHVLMKKAGLGWNDIDTLFLAGGFGNYINPEKAVYIGLLPGELLQRIIPVGNTSGAGVVQSLRSVDFDRRITNVINKSFYVELSEDEDFAMTFAMNMDFYP